MRRDVERVQERQAALQEQAQRAARRGQHRLADERPEQGDAEFQRVEDVATALRARRRDDEGDDEPHAEDREDGGLSDEPAQPDEHKGRCWQRRVGLRVHAFEDRDDVHDHGHHDRERGAEDGDGVGESALDLSPELLGLLDRGGKVVEAHDTRAASLASAPRRHIETTEDGRILSERVGEGVAGRQRVADGLDDLPESPIAGFAAERGEDPDQMETGLQHGGELAGEEHQRGEADTPTDAPERPLEHLAKGGSAGTIGSTEGDDELSAVSELLQQLRRVLRLLSAPADGAGGIHDLVLEDRHRYSWSATKGNTSSSVVITCATLRSPDSRNGIIPFLSANSRMWSAETPERIMPRTSAVMRKTSNHATPPGNPGFRHPFHPPPR